MTDLEFSNTIKQALNDSHVQNALTFFTNEFCINVKENDVLELLKNYIIEKAHDEYSVISTRSFSEIHTFLIWTILDGLKNVIQDSYNKENNTNIFLNTCISFDYNCHIADFYFDVIDCNNENNFKEWCNRKIGIVNASKFTKYFVF